MWTIDASFLFLLCLLPSILAQTSPVTRKRSLPRRQDNSTSLVERKLVARGPPTGWSPYLASGNDGGACYNDGWNRILPDFQMALGYSSVEVGLKECQKRGYKWGGLQNYVEVYCSNNQPVWVQNAPSSDCSARCSSGESCGGAYKMNVYSYTDPSTTKWTLQGCYQDGNARILGNVLVDWSMTAAKCQAYCAGKGFKIAGVENVAECYCGNSLSAPKIEDGRCNSRCSDGSSCGGAWTVSVYQLYTSPSWNYVSCFADGNPRALQGIQTSGNDMTNEKCTAFCASKGFALAGTQYYLECYCANTISAGYKAATEGECNTGCAGGGGAKCGGPYRLSLYSTLTGSALSSALGTAAASTTAAPAPAPTTPAPAPNPTPAPPTTYTPPTNFPGGANGNKAIYAHFIVGNAYPYDINTWRSDISRAQSAGIDGFMLNLGPDWWQPGKVADAYTAAQEKGFKMVLSFDMTEFDCGSWNRGPLFQTYLQNYINHPAAGKYSGKSILTTFAGEFCTFGRDNVNNGWNAIMGQWKGQIYFAPSYNDINVQNLGAYELGAEVNWGSAWPVAGKEIEKSRDEWYMQNLGGRGYIGTVSPLFAAHMPGKNWIWRGDNFLYGARWDQLLSMRDRTDIVQVVSWNDYGESTYINEIVGDMPQSVKDAGYVNGAFAHSALLSLQAFYSAAWKNGAYPTITKDKIWGMARPHQAWAGANGDAPRGRELTNDNLYIQVHLIAPASVILCANGCSTQQGQAGINRFSQPLGVGQTASARVERNGQIVARIDGSVVFSSNPSRYNFNYWILTSN